jgi:hypothetical protein
VIQKFNVHKAKKSTATAEGNSWRLARLEGNYVRKACQTGKQKEYDVLLVPNLSYNVPSVQASKAAEAENHETQCQI